VAKLFAVLPRLQDLRRRQRSADLALRAAAAEDADALFADAAAHAFTQGLPLGDWLENLSWVDPLTGSPLPPPRCAPNWADPDEASALSEASGAAASHAASTSEAAMLGAPVESLAAAAEVTRATLLPFLELVAASWLGAGVALQVAAFRRGLGDVVELEGPGVGLAFAPSELRDLFCGPDAVEWTEQSLRKTLRPTGGLKEDENTMVSRLIGSEQAPRGRKCSF
jgi:hypothetical protein